MNLKKVCFNETKINVKDNNLYVKWYLKKVDLVSLSIRGLDLKIKL
jgi:hypothetical protein